MLPKIHIPSPCSEDWSKMKIGHQSRFCESCTKSVMDFTQMTREEILIYLLENNNKKVCGRIYRSQLDFSTSDYLITITQLSKTTKNTNLAFYLLAFGAIVLAGCETPTTAQNPPPNDSISIVSIVADSLENTPKKCVPHQTINEETKPPLLGKIAMPEDFIVGEIVPVDTLHTPTYAEVMPEFYGGMDSLQHYIQQHLIQPKKKKEGVVIVQFIVLKDGSIIQPEILKALGEPFDKAVTDLVTGMPNWKPGENNGEKIDVLFTLPIVFKN